jgi:hypothetical protein
MHDATDNRKKKKKHNLPLFLVFIDYEKAYDKVKLWEVVDNKIPNYLLSKLKCIYRKTKVRIKFIDSIYEPIHINKGVRQGCGLSPARFNPYSANVENRVSS